MRDDAAVARALPVAAYMLLGARSFSRARGLLLWRLLRTPFTALGALLPVVAGGLFLWLYAMPSSGRTRVLTENPSIRVFFENVGFEMTGGVLIALLAVVAVVTTGRAAADAMLFGSYRASWLPDVESLGKRLRRSWVPFVGVALMQFGLLVGGTMFLTPLADLLARMLVRHAGQAGAGVVMFGLAGVCVLTIAWLRFFAMVIASHVIWRPSFFAGTVVAALSAPISQRKSYTPLLLLWLIGCSGWVLMASIAAAPIVGSLATGGTPVTRDGVLFSLILAAGFTACTWFDAVLVGLVGHRLGDVGATRQPQAGAAGELPQVPIRLAPFGAFPVGPHEAYTAALPFARSLRELLGHEIVLDPLERWVLPADQLVATGEYRSAAGGVEVAVAAKGLSPAVEEQAAPARRLLDLQKQLARGVFRTDAGGSELIYRG